MFVVLFLLLLLLHRSRVLSRRDALEGHASPFLTKVPARKFVSRHLASASLPRIWLPSRGAKLAEGARSGREGEGERGGGGGLGAADELFPALGTVQCDHREDDRVKHEVLPGWAESQGAHSARAVLA